MPDKKKKRFSDLLSEAGNSVLGTTEQAPTAMSEEELLSTFAQPEKKKSSPSASPEVPPEIQEASKLGDSYKPPVKESWTGSSSQSDDNGISAVQSTMSKFNQRLLDLPAQVLETSAIIGSELEKAIPMEEGRTEVEKSYMYKAADKYRQWIKEIYPTNPKVEREDPLYSHTIAGSAGDLAALVATAGTSREAEALNALTQASKGFAVKNIQILSPAATELAKHTAKQATSSGVLTGAIQMGTAEWEQAKANGATDEQAFEVFYKNAAVGSVMEAIPVMHFYKRLDTATGGGLKSAIKRMSVAGTAQGLEEMTTEVAQQFYSNYTASETYDATRKFYDGVVESGGIGFGLGFVLGAMGTSLRKKQAVAQTPQEKADIQLSLDFVTQKSAELENGKLTDQGQQIGEDVPAPENTVQAENNLQEEAPVESPEVTTTIDSQESLPTETQPTEILTEEQTIDTPADQELTAQQEVITPENTQDVEFTDMEQTPVVEDIVPEETTVNEPKVQTIQEVEAEEIVNPVEQEMVTRVKEGDDLETYRDQFETEEDFNTVKEYINEISKEQPDPTASPEGQVVEEGPQEESPESGVIGTIRDKSERLANIDPTETGERERLATEIVQETDKLIAQQESRLQEEGTELKDRSFAKQVLENPDISPEIKEGLTEEGRKYIPITNKLTIKEADAIINVKGLEQATEDFKDRTNAYHPAVRTMMGELLIKKYNSLVIESTDPVVKQKAADQAVKVADDLAIHLTALGQAIQAASVFSQLSPEGVVIHVQKNIQKKIEGKLSKIRGDIKATREEINKINEESIKEVLSGKLKAIIGTAKEKSQKAKRKEFVAKADKFLESIKVKTGKNIQEASLFAIPIATYNAAIDTIRLSIKAGDLVATAIEKGIKVIRAQHKGEWDEKGFREQPVFIELQKDEVVDPTKVVKSALKDSDIKMEDIITKHYTSVSQSKKSLLDKIVDDAGLDRNVAKDLVAEIETAFDKLATQKKRQYLQKKISRAEKLVAPKAAKKKEQLHEKIIKLTNQQVFTSKAFEDIYAESFDLPKLTPEQIQKITELADRVQTAKGAEAKNKATQDLLRYQEGIKGINWSDVGMALWYSNILSGLSTQAVNIYAGFAETAAEVYTSTVQLLAEGKPKDAAKLAIALFQGYGKGLLSAQDVLKTGYNPVRNDKVDVQGILERTTFKGGVWNPYNYSKYVGRMMSAADIFAYAGIKEMRSQQLAMRMALKEGKDSTTVDMQKRANEILYNTKERVEEAKIQAEQEGLKGLAKKRRINEIVEESRPADLNEDAQDFAARGTFNYDPEGLLGTLTHGINYVTNTASIKGVKPLQFIVPFTRIIANVTNRYLDWTPWGAVRAARGQMGYENPILGDKHVKVFTPEERRRELIKSITGTAGMIALFAMTEPDEEGDSAMEITADGTGDFKKNYELQETGWRPYSIKIGDKWYEYKNTALAIPFAWIGQYRDAQKYHGQQGWEDKLSIITMGSAKYLMDMSFLSALSDFFSAFGKEQQQAGSWLEKAGKSTARTAKSFVVPNAYTQLARSYQEVSDLPMKKASGVLDDLVRDVPVLRDNLQNMYNSLGDPVYPDQNRKYYPFKMKGDQNDKVWDLIIKNQAWIGPPSKTTLIYDESIDGERKMTDDEYNKFAILAGRLTKKRILDHYDELSAMKASEAQERIKDYKEGARKSAKWGFRLKGRDYADWEKENLK
jgi:hypothetical protein